MICMICMYFCFIFKSNFICFINKFYNFSLHLMMEYTFFSINSSMVMMTILFDWMSLLFMSFVLFISSSVVFMENNM